MPLPIYIRLGMGEVKPTTIKLELGNKSYIFPRGEVDSIMVKVDKFIFQADFVVLDMEEDKDVPISMCQPFLSL